MSNAIKIISSQRYLDQDIVDSKIITEDITLPVYLLEINGEDFAILADGHHRRAAAIAAGFKVTYDIKSHPEMLTGEDLMDAMYGDSDYYFLETGVDAF